MKMRIRKDRLATAKRSPGAKKRRAKPGVPQDLEAYFADLFAVAVGLRSGARGRDERGLLARKIHGAMHAMDKTLRDIAGALHLLLRPEAPRKAGGDK